MSAEFRKVVQARLTRMSSKPGLLDEQLQSLVRSMESAGSAAPGSGSSVLGSGSSYSSNFGSSKFPRPREGEVVYRTVRMYPGLAREVVQVSRVRTHDRRQDRLSERGSGEEQGRKSIATPVREGKEDPSSTNTSGTVR